MGGYNVKGDILCEGCGTTYVRVQGHWCAEGEKYDRRAIFPPPNANQPPLDLEPFRLDPQIGKDY